jgi:site-specific recombinase XerD
MELTRAIEYFASWGHHNYSKRTLELYVGHLRKFAVFIGDKDIEVVNLFDDVISYALHLERTGHRDNTVNLSMTSIRQLWRMLANLERQLGIRLPFLGAAIPVKKLVVAKSHRPICEEDFTSLMQTITESDAQPLIRARDLAVFALLHDTGLRISELTSLNVSNLDLSRRSAEVVTRKRVDHFKRREVYWTLETHIALLGYLDRRQELVNSDVLLINLSDRERLTPRSIQRSLKGYLRSAGLDPSGISPHSFRHSVGKRAAQSQMYPPLLQSLLGHRNPNSSQVYYNIQNESLRHEYHAKLGDMRTEKVYEKLKLEGKKLRWKPA